MASVKVAVRVRPLNKRERDMNCSINIAMDNNMTTITNTRIPAGAGENFSKERVKQFTFDHSYWSVDLKDDHYVSQEKVYEDLGKEVVGSAYHGYNACVFAYGQTGSGKTHTMMGEVENYGLIPRICRSLFDQMLESTVTYRTEVSYLEIYNEHVRDLLRGPKHAKQNLRVREHPKEGPYVQDLSKHLVLNYDNVQELIADGNSNRTTATTNMNDASSRSHAIFTISFTQARFDDGTPSEIHSKINLVDLAGCERSDLAGTVGDRLKEGASINKSLVTLGSVISALADSSVASSLTPHSKALFIPYRNSVLTWLLKDSLGGNAKTIMIATISPADCYYAETLSTLRYASRAKRIVNRPTINEDPNVKLIRELREENARLRALLDQQGNLTAMQEQLSRNEEKVKQLTDLWTDKWQEAATILREHKMLALRKEGMGVILDSELPYLLAIDDNILSTGMKLYHIKEGETLVGREDAGTLQDIELEGGNIEAEHCIIRHVAGEVELVPLEGARCCINNVSVEGPTKLNQGAIIRLGRRHLFRFNHPREAAKMRLEYRGNVVSQLANMMQQDVRLGCSTLSISDSALGSDLDLCTEPKTFCECCEKLEEHRRRLEHQERDPVTSRSQSLPRLSDHQTDTLQYRQHLAVEANHDEHQTAEAVRGPHVLPHEPKRTFQVELCPFLTESIPNKRTIDTCNNADASNQDMHSKMRLDGGATGPNMADDDRSRCNNERAAGVDMDEDDMVAEELADSLFDVEDLKFQFELAEPSVPSSPVTDDMKCVTLDITAESLLSLMDDRPLTDWTVEDLSDRLAHLSLFIHQLHARVCCVLQRKYGSVVSSKDVTSGLSDEVLSQFTAIRPVFDRLEKLLQLHTRETDLVDQLYEYNAMLQTADTFLTLHHLFQDLELHLSRHAFTKVIEGLARVHSLLASLEAEQELERNVITVFHTEACILREKSLFEVSELWKASFRWTFPSRFKKTGNHPRQPTTLELYCHDDGTKERLQCAVQAMHSTGMLESRLRAFSEAIVGNFVKIAVSDRSALIETCVTSDAYVIQLVNLEISCRSPRRTPVPPAEAFQKLELLFQFLHTALSGIVVKNKNDSSADAGIMSTLIEQIGNVLIPRLFDCVYGECLSLAVPRCGRQWDVFCDMMSAIERFQTTLTTLKFMSSRHRLLTDYLTSVKVLFMSIKNEELLHRADELVMQDLLVSTPVSGEHPLGISECEADADGEREGFVKMCREEAGTVNYRLPKCRVSDPVRRLAALAYDTLREAMAGSKECAVHLCHSVHRVFDCYCEVVPSQHAEKLSTLPLLAALHHNNCMFVAHHVITVDRMFQRKQTVGGNVASISDPGYAAQLVAKVRKAGNEAFTAHINATKGELRRQLGHVETFECVADNDGATATAAVSNMLDHLRHISSVWRDVLPTNTYCRAIGCLLNAALANIIDSVMSIEEFSALDCDRLHTVLSLITNVAADYFQTEASTANPQVTLHECVTTWLRFKELVLFFDCGMQGVADRWADGKGPLALHLTATEVRRLVTAVFENTRRRDVLLSQLKL